MYGSLMACPTVIFPVGLPRETHNQHPISRSAQIPAYTEQTFEQAFGATTVSNSQISVLFKSLPSLLDGLHLKFSRVRDYDGTWV